MRSAGGGPLVAADFGVSGPRRFVVSAFRVLGASASRRFGSSASRRFTPFGGDPANSPRRATTVP
ncbi:hypothetical protein DJ71_01230 [Halorubrum sp. E3]|nr:hypothetical protein DJ71_01230 [Halorubrum sp. E3]